MNTISSIDNQINHAANQYKPPSNTEKLKYSLKERGFAHLPGLIEKELLQALREECHRLLGSHGIERDFLMKQTANTPRRMVNVRQQDISTNGKIIPALYKSEAMKHLFEEIAGCQFMPCPYKPEEFIINALFKSGNTHGWHWDDYKYGIVFAVEVPEKENGGYVQVVPNSRWNRQRPSVEDVLFDSVIHSFRLEPGDAYIIRTDTSMHRVSEINDGAKRVVVNMVWAAADEVDRVVDHSTMEELFS
ncbi:HalD/BesD family halogenase [Leptothrix discophora]|uniref:ArpA protein n=1 Tax=Leptothrix discophora TaxID=89 RepID=A0ABT9G2W7_LEPDI|nr:hypothetical protein [Leptothrix discophora]MDP4300831.1 hypothetical protein [Leptothrix discophora]